MRGFWFSLPDAGVDTLETAGGVCWPFRCSSLTCLLSCTLLTCAPLTYSCLTCSPHPLPPSQAPCPPVGRLHLHLLSGHGRAPSRASRARCSPSAVAVLPLSSRSPSRSLWGLILVAVARSPSSRPLPTPRSFSPPLQAGKTRKCPAKQTAHRPVPADCANGSEGWRTVRRKQHARVFKGGKPTRKENLDDHKHASSDLSPAAPPRGHSPASTPPEGSADSTQGVLAQTHPVRAYSGSLTLPPPIRKSCPGAFTF